MNDKVFVCKTESVRIQEDEVVVHHRLGHLIRRVFPEEKAFLREAALMQYGFKLCDECGHKEHGANLCTNEDGLTCNVGPCKA